MPTMTLLNEKQIAAVEAYYDAKYVCDTSLRNKHGGWANLPVALFYTEKKHPEGSNYFGLYYDNNGKATITDGISGTAPFEGLLLIDDTIAYSRYRHDYRSYSVDGRQIAVDGGREYLKRVGDLSLVKAEIMLQVEGAELKIITERYK